jgi:hypothetical protein
LEAPEPLTPAVQDAHEPELHADEVAPDARGRNSSGSGSAFKFSRVVLPHASWVSGEARCISHAAGRPLPLRLARGPHPDAVALSPAAIGCRSRGLRSRPARGATKDPASSTDVGIHPTESVRARVRDSATEIRRPGGERQDRPDSPDGRRLARYESGNGGRSPGGCNGSLACTRHRQPSEASVPT